MDARREWSVVRFRLRITSAGAPRPQKSRIRESDELASCSGVDWVNLTGRNDRELTISARPCFPASKLFKALNLLDKVERMDV